MTLEDIQDAVAHIEEIQGDDERAHGEEDDLYEDFVRYIANDAPVSRDIAKMAAQVLRTKQLDFARWCA